MILLSSLYVAIIGGLNTCHKTEKRYLTDYHPPPKTHSLSHSLKMKMKVILLVTLVSLTLGAIPLPGQRSEAEMDLVLSRNENGPFEKRNKLLHPHI